MKKNLLILGAGQYGQVVRELAESLDCYGSINFLDDNSPLAVGKIENLERFISLNQDFAIALGNGKLRESLKQRIQEKQGCLSTLVSPKAYVSPSAKVGAGCIVEPMAVVNTGAVVGDCSIISAGAIVNHNAEIGSFAHLDCGCLVKAREVIPDFTKVEK